MPIEPITQLGQTYALPVPVQQQTRLGWMLLWDALLLQRRLQPVRAPGGGWHFQVTTDCLHQLTGIEKIDEMLRAVLDQKMLGLCEQGDGDERYSRLFLLSADGDYPDWAAPLPCARPCAWLLNGWAAHIYKHLRQTRSPFAVLNYLFDSPNQCATFEALQIGAAPPDRRAIERDKLLKVLEFLEQLGLLRILGDTVELCYEQFFQNVQQVVVHGSKLPAFSVRQPEQALSLGWGDSPPNRPVDYAKFVLRQQDGRVFWQGWLSANGQPWGQIAQKDQIIRVDLSKYVNACLRLGAALPNLQVHLKTKKVELPAHLKLSLTLEWRYAQGGEMSDAN
jgi:hypothetical protein